MSTNKFKLYEVSLFGEHEGKLIEFLDTLKESPTEELVQWLNAFQHKNVILLTGKKFSYGVNFHYTDSIGCPFLVKNLDSVSVENCLVGGCNIKIGLILYHLFSKGISCLQTLKDLEKDEISLKNFSDLNIKETDDANNINNIKDKSTALTDLMSEVERNISMILSLSISPSKGKLDELIDALYPMITDKIKNEFELMQK